MTTSTPAGAAPADPEVAARLDGYRTELTGYCYRMLGSAFEADDAVQETMLRAWRAYDRFEGRSSLRSWLYRIATNVCFDHLDGRKRRARPMELGPAQEARIENLGDARPASEWIEPVPDARVVPAAGDPSEQLVARESVRLAFVAAIQHLAPRQRATLILREVLRMSAQEVAELLDTTVAGVNSALQRARSTLETTQPTDTSVGELDDDEARRLLARYVDAFERYDIDALVSILHEDATLSMPPYALWLQGPVDISRWFLGPGEECRGSRLVPVRANGSYGFAQYRPSGPGGAHRPWSLQVLELRGGRIGAINAFLDTEHLYPLFGLGESPPSP